MKTLAGAETSKLVADCEMSSRDEMSTSELQITLLHRESLLRGETIKKSNVFTNQDARRHFHEGFVRRHYMLQSSRLFLEEHCSLDRQTPLSPYEATDCAIHVNAYYANLRGALDNLAWVLQYERNILNGVAEDERQNRQRCYLFDKTFVNSLKNADFELGTVIEGFQRWAAGLAELRDPACHRIPIYVPPSVITRQKELQEFRSIEKLASLPESERAGKTVAEIYREAQGVAPFVPVMILSNRRGLERRVIGRQIALDHDKYLLISMAIVDAL